MNPALLLIVALAAGLTGVSAQVTLLINGTGTSCSFNPARGKVLKCAEKPDPNVTRFFAPISDPIPECANECARLRRENGYMCTGFLFRANTFSPKSKRLTCTMFSCRKTKSSSIIGVAAMVMPESCFETNVPTASPSKPPTAAPTTSSPSNAPTTPEPSKAPTRSPTSKPTPTPWPTRRTKTPISARPTVYVPTKEPTLAAATPRPTDPAAALTRVPTPPTDSPTVFIPTTFPTPAPTDPTSAPTFLRNTFAPATGFPSPSGIPLSMPFDRTLFYQIVNDASLCMIIQPQMGRFTVTFENFFGTVNDCMKECQYDASCTGVLYSSILNLCQKAVQLEFTDDANKITAFQNEKWVGFAKVPSSVPYYSGFCSQFAAANSCSTVNTSAQCKWGVGKRGYNQMRHTDTGYCGRVACTLGRSG